MLPPWISVDSEKWIQQQSLKSVLFPLMRKVIMERQRCHLYSVELETIRVSAEVTTVTCDACPCGSYVKSLTLVCKFMVGQIDVLRKTRRKQLFCQSFSNSQPWKYWIMINKCTKKLAETGSQMAIRIKLAFHMIIKVCCGCCPNQVSLALVCGV